MKKISSMAFAAILPLSFAHATSANELEDLKEEVKILKAEVTALKTEQKKSVKADPDGGLLIGKTKLTVGGYIKGDLVYTTNGAVGSANALIAPANTRTADSDADDRVDLSARESRLWIKTNTEVAGKPFKTHLETDFYGSSGNEFVSNSHSVRIRHAYGQWGNLLFGHTWSTFMDPTALGEINAFGQHASPIFVRQGQIRYTQPFANGSLMMAVENAEDGGDDDNTPDLAARLNFDGKWGHASVSGLLRKMGDDSNRDWENAFSVSAKLPVFGRDDIRLQYNDGALGRYMGLAHFLESGLDLARDVWGASIAYRHFWSQSLRSTVMYSKTEADDKDIVGLIDDVDSTHINLMWSPSPKLRYGIEYATWNLSLDGVESDFDAVQISARYLY